MLYIGIDPGVKTGFAIWDTESKNFDYIAAMPIHEAMQNVITMSDYLKVKVIVEDARKRKWFGKNSNAKQQGAGSIKRDCKIWEDFLTDYGIDYEMMSPGKSKTKITSAYFKKLSGWEKATNEHGRDAAMLVIGL